MKKVFMGILFMAMTAMGYTGQSQEVEGFVSGLLQTYPKARLLDIYKSCFQDYMGAEHLVGDTASARGYLERELQETADAALMPWYYEPCGINGQFVRVNLRAIHEGLVSTDTLRDAFVSSANAERPSVEQWAERWHEIIGVVEHMELCLPQFDEDKRFIEEVLASGRYAISHSPDYREAYAPHYRIVQRDIFEQKIKPLLPCPCCH